ncbi:VanZ like family protein [Agromyces sp. CF514]|uniref:VanZ family protein n=1 Tax=Agromyces sp. CF514 TaxID=1881031 RepID=UPI0008ECC568|nr:VanZ family protein [Agromyces sp. CF514]SFR79455.1 VanZ like family protein [Agromyces sp. CF514]
MTRAEPIGASTSTTSTTRTALSLLFAIYLFLLVWLVLWKLQVPSVGGVERVVKLVPFVSTASAGASAMWEVTGNLLAFIPFGLYLGLLAPRMPWWKATAVVAATSAMLEAAQFALAIGRSDLTDVIMNASGGLVGFALAVLLRRALGTTTGRAMTVVCAIGTAVALVAVATFAAAPITRAPRGSMPMSSSMSASMPVSAGGPASAEDRGHDVVRVPVGAGVGPSGGDPDAVSEEVRLAALPVV